MELIRDKIFEITLWADNTQKLDNLRRAVHQNILVDLARGTFNPRYGRFYFYACCNAMADHWQKRFKITVSKKERELLQIHYLTEFYRIIAQKNWGDLDQKCCDLVSRIPWRTLRKLPIE